MVDAIISFSVQRLGDFLIQEAVLLHHVKDEVDGLINELKWMQSFLRDAGENQRSDARVHLWVSEIRDITFCTQDIIDSFHLKVNKIKSSNWGLQRFSIMKYVCICGKTDFYGIGKEIRALRNRMADIINKREIYGIGISDGPGVASSSSSTSQFIRRTTSYSYRRDEHFVGFEDDIRLLEEKLVVAEPQCCVISILGMGGLGKTTIASKLYNSYIRDRFTKHAWIYVSQDWSPRNILEKIIKSFTKLPENELKEMTDDDIERCIRKTKGSHLVVLDDVWDVNVFTILRRALPDNMNRSRIIITTRINEVAEIPEPRTYIHRLRFLREDESWDLFCQKAVGVDYSRYQRLELLGKDLLSVCGGLPLAILVLRGLLSRKQPHQYREVSSILKKLTNEPNISSLLDLSYMDLPYQVKPFFLYLGIFPKDFAINAEKIVSMWVAEEIIPQEEGVDLEENVWEYLQVLIDRSLIQVVKRNWRTVTEFQVHDVLRDLAVRKATDTKFNHRSQFQRCVLLDHSAPDVSSLLYPSNKFKLQPKLLRVLDLQGTQFYTNGKEMFADEIGKLIHLRYLGLKDTDMDVLPSSIGKLLLLQTLETSVYTHTTLPREICRLTQLKHLRGYFSMSSSSLVELKSLQTIKVIQTGNRPRQEARDEFALIDLASLKHLKYLSLWSYSDYLLVDPLECTHLIELRILGQIDGVLPEQMHKSLPNLQYLELSYSKMRGSPMLVLEKFQNLIVLDLNNRALEHIECTANGFPRLEFLRIVRNKLQTFNVNEEAMPRLRALTVMDSPNAIFPKRFRSLQHVEGLNREWDQIFFVSIR